MSGHKDFKGFERAGNMTEQDISGRQISETIWKLIKGALIIDTTTYLFSLASPKAGIIGCFIGLWIVGASIFAHADPLDKKRWLRYWHGDLLGYWLTYLPLTIILIEKITTDGEYYSEGELLALDFFIYLLASLMGLFVGFLNVRRTDQHDKKQILSQYWEWQRSKSQPQVTA